METEERPEEGSYLEVWIDIPEVGEPTVIYWSGEGSAEEVFHSYLQDLDEHDIEVLAQAKPFDDRDEWILHSEDPSCGGVAYWIRHRDG
jgi:hypothetical protein